MSLLNVSPAHGAKEKGKDNKAEEKAVEKKSPSKKEKATEGGDASQREAEASAEPDADADADPGASASPSASANVGAGGVVASSPRPDRAVAPTIMFLDAGLRSDLGLLYMRSRIGRLQEAEDFDIKSFGPIVNVGILTQFFWKFRIGAALGYGFNYRLTERLTKFEKEQQEGQDQDQVEWVLGQLYTADVRLEFSQELADKVWLVLTPRGGIQAVLVGDDLKDQTEAYEDSYNVRQGPQLGLLGGFDIGARYMLTDWFSLRLTGGYAYFSQGLLRAKRRGDAADADFLWRMRGTRVGGNLAMEAHF